MAEAPSLGDVFSPPRGRAPNRRPPSDGVPSLGDLLSIVGATPGDGDLIRLQPDQIATIKTSEPYARYRKNQEKALQRYEQRRIDEQIDPANAGFSRGADLVIDILGGMGAGLKGQPYQSVREARRQGWRQGQQMQAEAIRARKDLADAVLGEDINAQRQNLAATLRAMGIDNADEVALAYRASGGKGFQDLTGGLNDRQTQELTAIAADMGTSPEMRQYALAALSRKPVNFLDVDAQGQVTDLRNPDAGVKLTQLGDAEYRSRMAEGDRNLADAARLRSPTSAINAPSGYRFNADGSLSPIKGGPADPTGPKASTVDFSRADKLRDEYNANSKDFLTIADNYAAMQEVARDNSAAGDLSLIFSYMKLLDPGSVVREQEFANAQNAGGVPDRVRAAWNKALRGERLSPNQRADFMKQAGNVYAAKERRHNATVKKRYTEQAQRWGLNPADVVGDFAIAPAGATGAAAPRLPAGWGVEVR